MDTPFQVLPEVSVLPAHAPIPGVGFLPINAFVIKAQEPVLVDTGMGIDTDEFIKALKSIIDLGELKWIVLTHDDPDHIGSFRKVLELVPNATIALNAIAAMRMNTTAPLPMDRLHWLNPGDSITAGNHKLTALRPPIFDNPTTIAFYDEKLNVLFSADCFGAIIPSPVQSAWDIPEEALDGGMTGWASSDSPWLHMVDKHKFNQALDTILHMNPKVVFSSHLPPAQGRLERLVKLLRAVPDSPPFVAPDQKALEMMLQQMKPEGL